ncbi:MAG: response regulator [Mucilaginibacter polytrichastri]|nr:response regulator [Mucilaginibacter polytrichastri]
MKNIAKKIMLADDDEGIVDAIETMLYFEGYEVIATTRGERVLLTEHNLPDLFLLDIWMSGEDGTEICRKLKSQPLTRNIPVLMISASKDIRQSAIDAGADDYLPKPFEMEQLLQKIEHLIARTPAANPFMG